MKAEAAHSAQEAAAAYDRLIVMFTKMHAVPYKPINWHMRAAHPLPPRPAPSAAEIRNKIENFQPNFVQKAFGSKGARKKLNTALEQAHSEDERAADAYSEEKRRITTRAALALKVLEGDADALIQAFDQEQTLSKVAGLGEGLSVSFGEKGFFVELDCHELDDLPSESYSLTAAGKLSVKALSKKQRYELHLRNIASASFRVAAEVFSALPVDEFVLHAMTDLLDMSNGHEEEKRVADIRFVRATFEKLNLNTLDPVIALERFQHELKFNLKSGLQSIEQT